MSFPILHGYEKGGEGGWLVDIKFKYRQFFFWPTEYGRSDRMGFEDFSSPDIEDITQVFISYEINSFELISYEMTTCVIKLK